MDKGIIENKNKALDDFVKHIKNVEEAYWKKFKVFKRWQEGMYKKFEATGIVELFTGFRCKGYLGRNEIVNYSFQGTAFHCLLWSLTQINAELAERKMESKVIAQIHDNGILDCPPDECDEVQALCTEIATQRIKKEFPWLIVPLSIEWESTMVDGSWYSKKEIEEED
jgi:DNA polymerase I-like protein with 3'-5' exonuclease and polymerase domains